MSTAAPHTQKSPAVSAAGAQLTPSTAVNNASPALTGQAVAPSLDYLTQREGHLRSRLRQLGVFEILRRGMVRESRALMDARSNLNCAVTNYGNTEHPSEAALVAALARVEICALELERLTEESAQGGKGKP